jgi:bis(5'-nucleosyl)-tetraphosphatase (symmetrical)
MSGDNHPMEYLIGDVQGCCSALERLLQTIDFSASRDRIYVLGDLVNRGPRSLDTMRLLRDLGSSATCLLGNHDLHLLAVAHGLRKPHRSDTMDEILAAPDRDELLAWLSRHRLACFEQGWLMVHAGLAPQWDLDTTLRLAGEVERQLQGDQLIEFLQVMYGNEPTQWRADLAGFERMRFIVNVFTRIRFCDADGHLDLSSKGDADTAPPGFMPWFEVPGRRTAGIPVAFGHWSTLGLLNRPELLALDTGCVWGGQLTAVRIDGGRRDIVQVDCEQAQRPALPKTT